MRKFMSFLRVLVRKCLKLAYNNVAVQQFSHYATRTAPQSELWKRQISGHDGKGCKEKLKYVFESKMHKILRDV